MRKIIIIGVLLTALIGSLVFTGVSAEITEETKDYVKDNIKDDKTAPDDSEEFRVIVTLKGEKTQKSIDALKGKVTKLNDPKWDKVYPNGLIATVTEKQYRKLLKDDNVKRVDIDVEVHAAIETANYWSGATKARHSSASIGYNVDGDRTGNRFSYNKNDVVIAILDTGIDESHKDLDGTNNGGTKKVIGWKDYVNGYTYAYDDNGHGTHVASIAAGEGDANPGMKGVAPGAALVGVKVLNSYGSGYSSTIISGINWVVANKATYGIKIMSLSLSSYGSSYGNDPMCIAVNNAYNNGIVVVVAAGNAGPQKYTISTPSAAANAITVGAMADPGYLLRYLPGVTANEMDITPPVSKDKTVDATGQMSLKDNGFYLAPFSSRGPTARNIRKPDVVAPGVNIMAAKSKYPKPTTLHGGYIEKSGTSMAAPFVAGVAALMLDANYARTPANIKSYIRASAQEWGVSGCDFDYGCGLIRAYKAVGYAKTGSIPAGDQWTPKHSRHNAYMTDTVSSKYYTKTISSDAYPFAATLIMYDWSGYNYGVDLDLYVYDPDGNIIAGSSGIYRQDTVSVAPDDLGRYKTRVYKYIGSGRYSLDISEV